MCDKKEKKAVTTKEGNINLKNGGFVAKWALKCGCLLAISNLMCPRLLRNKIYSCMRPIHVFLSQPVPMHPDTQNKNLAMPPESLFSSSVSTCNFSASPASSAFPSLHIVSAMILTQATVSCDETILQPANWCPCCQPAARMFL